MIPVNINRLNQKSKKLLAQCVETGWVSSEGSFVKEFEENFAKYVGTKYAIAVNSGTSALHIALAAAGIGKGDEVILPASTIAACYFAIWYVGAKAVPIDVDLNTYNLDPSLLEQVITPNTKALMPVHLFGRPCDMRTVMRIAKKHKLIVIEDAAEAHGATIGQKKAGSLGTIGCFSFYANKLVTTGEGGMVVTSNKELAETARRLRSLNHNPTKRFTHLGLGYSFGMSNLQAAVGVAELQVIEKNLIKKEQIAKTYQKGLEKIPGIVLPKKYPNGRQTYWMYAIRIEEKIFGCSRDDLSDKLKSEFAIQTRTFFYDPSTAFKDMRLFTRQRFPVAALIAKSGLYLPSGTGTSLKEIRFVISAIKTIAKRYQKSNTF